MLSSVDGTCAARGKMKRWRDLPGCGHLSGRGCQSDGKFSSSDAANIILLILDVEAHIMKGAVRQTLNGLHLRYDAA